MVKLIECKSAGELPQNLSGIDITTEGPDEQGKYMAWATSGTGHTYRSYYQTHSTFASEEAAAAFLRQSLLRMMKNK